MRGTHKCFYLEHIGFKSSLNSANEDVDKQ